MRGACGHEVASGARFCGTCGAAVPPPAAPEPEANPSTPWPTAPRGAGRRVSVDKTPTVAVAATTPFAPPGAPVGPAPVGATPAPPLGPPPFGPPPGAPGPGPPGPVPPMPDHGRDTGPPGPGRAIDRRTPLILGALVLVLVVAVLGLSLKILGGSDDEADDDRVASSSPTSTEDPDPPTTETPTTAPPATTAAPPSTATPTTAAPVTPPPTAAPGTAPPTVPRPVVATADELAETLVGYISALDVGDVDAAYSYIGPALRAREGWDFAEFSRFWTEDVVGATVIDIDSASTSSGQLVTTIDYQLPDGATSREQIRVVFAPGGDGLLVMDDYEVLDAEVTG